MNSSVRATVRGMPGTMAVCEPEISQRLPIQQCTQTTNLPGTKAW